MPSRVGGFVICALLLLLIAAPPMHASNGNQVHVGQSITIPEGEDAGDVVCVGCSIRVDGACGDAVAVGGSITVNGQVRGDAVAVGGAIRMGEDGSIRGDVVTVGGRLWRHPNSVVGGTVSTQSGAVVFAILLISTVLPVILIVALIVWLVNRSRRPAPVRA
jgi:hypothetical protein